MGFTSSNEFIKSVISTGSSPVSEGFFFSLQDISSRRNEIKNERGLNILSGFITNINLSPVKINEIISNKRNISPDAVQALISKSLKHLIFYGSAVKNFTFLNHENSNPKVRTIIKDTYSGSRPLSVACQAHFKNFNKYQFTVITAIDDDIYLGSGQYFIEFVDECHSFLKKFENGSYIEILSCQD